MKAVRVHKAGGPEVLQIDEDVQKPTCLKNEVLIKVHSFGINPVEVYIREGQFPAVPPFPYIPGFDYSGVVEQIGDDLKGNASSLKAPNANVTVKVGERVYGFLRSKSGVYAEYITVDPKRDSILPLPTSLSFSEGAALTLPYYTAYFSLFTKSNLAKDDIVLVHGGSGAVGRAAIEMAVNFGCRVLATAGTPEGIEACKSAGAHAVFNHKTGADYVQKIKDWVKAEREKNPKKTEIPDFAPPGIDVIVETSAHFNMAIDCQLAGDGCRINVIGARSPCDKNQADAYSILGKSISIHGVLLFKMLHQDFLLAQDNVHHHVTAGKYKPLVQKFKLEDVQQSHIEIITPAKGGASARVVVDIL